MSSIDLGSILLFASCIIHRPLVFADIDPLNTHGSYGFCQGEQLQNYINSNNDLISKAVFRGGMELVKN